MESLTLKSVLRIKSPQDIKDAIATIFQEAQLSLSSHRKLVIILKKVLQRAVEFKYQEYFSLSFTKMINKILPLKKGEQVGDRIAKFCSLFIRSLNDDEIQRRKKENEMEVDNDDSDEEEESHIDAFIKYIIHHLLRGIESKDRNVRYRVVQLLAYLVNQILEIDYDTYQALYISLSKRIFDKEPMVRIQTIISLAKFQVYDFQIEENDEGDYSIPITKDLITDKIVGAIKNDESAEVRRAALINLTRSQENFEHLIRRARDLNSINRRLVYSRVSRELGDFRDFDPIYRENLLKWGLNDRDESVRKAAIKMLTYDWSEFVNNDILELIESLDVLQSEIAELAILIYYKERPDIFSDIKFTDQDWKELTVEKAFFIRTYYNHCNSNNLYDLIDSNFPESADLAEILQKYFRLRISHMEDNSDILKIYHANKNSLQTENDKLFALNVELNKVKGEVDHSYKNLHKLEENVDSLAYQVGLYKKRKELLLDGEAEVEPLTNPESELDEEKVFLSLNAQELTEAIKTNEDDIVSCKNLIIKHETSVKTGEEKYTELERQYANAFKEREIQLSGCESFETENLTFLESLKELEFIIQQLLLIAKEYDFSDEIGRRKMLQIIRYSLMEDDLSNKLIELALGVLRKISINERDFTTMCTEIINDLRDYDDYEEDTFHSAVSGYGNDNEGNDNEENEVQDDNNDLDSDTSNKKRKVDTQQLPDDVVIRCLVITQHVLELAEEPLEHNLSLSSLRYSLVNYAIQQSHKEVVYTLGLKCFGLFALLDRESVPDALVLLNFKFRHGTEELRIIAAKAIVDILSTFGAGVIKDKSMLFSLARNLHKSLNQYEMPKLQCIVAESVCKLFLADIINDSPKSVEQQEGFESAKQLLESLVLCYFHPLTTQNEELKQILAFCIPVYAFSHPSHQIRLATISGDCIYRMFYEGGEFSQYDNKLSPNTVIQQLIHWCDPNNLVNVTQVEIKRQPSHVFQSISFLQVLEQSSSKVLKKAIINNLNKLAIYEDLRPEVLEGLLNGVRETGELLISNKDKPEFSFDKLTTKYFENFLQLITELHQKSVLREGINGEVDVNEISANSTLMGPTEGNDENPLRSPIAVDLENAAESTLRSPRLEASSGSSSYPNSRMGSPVPNTSHQENVEDTLQKIDQLLAEEEDVEYQIPLND